MCRRNAWAIIPIVLVAIYIFAFKFNGLLDMPNHLARAHIMRTCIVDPNNPLCNHYFTKISPFPYFLSDVTLMAYLSFFPPLLAEKIALFVLLSLFIISWYLFYKKINGSINIGYIAGLSLVLNNYFYNGFYAYLFSVVLALFWLTIWWQIRDSKTIINQIGLSFFMTVIFAFHLAGFLFVFIIYCLYDFYTAFSKIQSKLKFLINNFIKGTPIIVTFVGLYLLQQLSSEKSLMGAIEYKPLLNKMLTVLYPFINYSKLNDSIIVFLMFVVLIFSIDVSLIYRFTRNFWTIVSIIFFFFFIITPTAAHGVYDFDCRFLPIAYLTLFVAIGSINNKRSYCAYILASVLIVSFSLSLYYKNMTNKELLKIDDVLSYSQNNKKLIEINSIRNFPSDSVSRVSSFPHFSCYYILGSGGLVGGLFDCKSNPNISYFCYKDKKIQNLDYYKYQLQGINVLEKQDLIKIAQIFDYVLLISHGNEDYVRSKMTPDLFILKRKNDYIYLFEIKKIYSN